MDAKEEAKKHAKILVSSRKGDFYVLDRLDPHLQPTIFMTQRSAERLSATIPQKSLFKKFFGFLG